MKTEYCDYIWDVVTGDTQRHKHYVKTMRTWPDSIKDLIKAKPTVPSEPRGELVAIRTWDERLDIPKNWPSKKRILVAYHGDLLNNKVPDHFIHDVIKAIEKYPQHEYFLLTDNARRYIKFDWPSNCILGLRITDQDDARFGMQYLRQNEHNDLWLLFEPLTTNVNIRWDRICWAVFDAPKDLRKPKVIDVHLTAQSASRYRVPVYITDEVGYGEDNKEQPKRRT